MEKSIANLVHFCVVTQYRIQTNGTSVKLPNKFMLKHRSLKMMQSQNTKTAWDTKLGTSATLNEPV